MASSPAAWPLLSRVLSEVKSANDLVRWGLDEWGCRRVVGLRELRVAAVLFASSQDAGRSSAPPDWEGFLGARFDEEAVCVHAIGDDPFPPDVCIDRTCASSSVLDLALRFGHAELARCLQARGQEQRALRPEGLQRLPAGSLAKLPLEVRMRIDGGEEVQGEIWIGEWRQWEERGECHREYWLRPRNGDWQPISIVDDDRALHPWQPRPGDSSAADAQGRWASDWKAPTLWARVLVDTPATRAVLALAAEGLLPDLDEDAKLRLLDAALLLGEPEAAAALAGSCGPRRPLRIWDSISARMMWRPCDLAAEYAEAHLRAGLHDVQGLGFNSAVSVAELAVEEGTPGLARAVAELLPEGAWEMELESARVAERGSHGNAILRRGALAALEALGPPLQGCSVHVCVRSADTQQTRFLRTPLLFLPALLGDELAAVRLVHAGFVLQGSTGSGGSSISPGLAAYVGDPTLKLLRFRGDGEEVFISLKPVASRLEVTERILRLLFAAAASRSLCAVAATGRRGLLGRPGLLEHVASFAAVWTDGEEVFRQELTAMIGRDPLRGLSLRSGQRGAPAPATAATAQESLAAPPGHPSSEQVMQQAAGGHATERFADSTGPGQEPPVETRQTHPLQQVASPSAGPVGEAAGTEGHTTEKDEEAEEERLNRVLQQSELEAEQAWVQRAVLDSKAEAFNGQVYALLRLTRQRSPEVMECLLTSEELRACRDRVAAAGCELQPAWAGGAVLLVPTTWELYAELGLNLKGHHVLMLQSDVDRLEEALKALPCRQRPQVKRDHLAEWYEGAVESFGQEAAAGSDEGPRGGQPVAAEEVERPGGEVGTAGSADEEAAERPEQEDASFNGGQGSSARDEDDEQLDGQADEVVGAVSRAREARGRALAAAQEELLRSHGIVVQNTFWGGPDNHFEISMAPSAHTA